MSNYLPPFSLKKKLTASKVPNNNCIFCINDAFVVIKIDQRAEVLYFSFCMSYVVIIDFCLHSGHISYSKYPNRKLHNTSWPHGLRNKSIQIFLSASFMTTSKSYSRHFVKFHEKSQISPIFLSCLLCI